MNDQEDQLIREATGQGRDFVEPEPQETNDSNETGEETIGAMRFWEVCAKLQIPLDKFHST